MPAGRRNNKVIIQQLTSGQDEIGEPTQVWAELKTISMSILHKSGSESIKADKDVSIVQASFRGLYMELTNVTASMRAVHGSTTYEIKAVLPDEQSRKHTDLVCEIVNV